MAKKKKSEFFTKQEEAAMVRLAQAGDLTARNRLVENNYRFIWAATIKFVERYRIYTAEELVGHAAEAYMRAIEGFDLSRGFRLNTYAGQSIWRALKNSISDHRSTVRVPRSTQQNHSHGNCNPELVKQIECALRPTISLSHAADEGEENSLIPFVMPVIDEGSEESEQLRAAMNALSPRQRTVIEGVLQGQREIDIGVSLGVSSQRVWQIKSDAIGILRREMTRSRAVAA